MDLTSLIFLGLYCICHNKHALISVLSRCHPACLCCPGFCLAVTQTCWQMPAGPSLTSQMAQMTKSRLSLTLVSAGALWNYLCKFCCNSFIFVKTDVACESLTTFSGFHRSLCRHTDYKVASPALRAVGNIVTGDDIQTQVRVGSRKRTPPNYAC